MKATHFYDMHSGGFAKADHGSIAIPLPKGAAIELFVQKFGRHPYEVACSCCGENYSVTEHDSMVALLQIYPDAFVLSAPNA